MERKQFLALISKLLDLTAETLESLILTFLFIVKFGSLRYLKFVSIIPSSLSFLFSNFFPFLSFFYFYFFIFGGMGRGNNLLLWIHESGKQRIFKVRGRAKKRTLRPSKVIRQVHWQGYKSQTHVFPNRT
jgi:hypothetical protein